MTPKLHLFIFENTSRILRKIPCLPIFTDVAGHLFQLNKKNPNKQKNKQKIYLGGWITVLNCNGIKQFNKC